MAWPSDLVRTKDWGNETLTDADLEGQIDLVTAWVDAAFDLTTGHKHDGTANEGPKILTANIDDAAGAQGEVMYSSGTVLTHLAVGTSGQFLKTQGAAANPVWATVNQDQTQAGSIVQIVNTQSGAVATGTTAMPKDDTIPQNTEGDEYMTLAITPGATDNNLIIEVICYLAVSTTGTAIAALFQDSTAGALAVGIVDNGETGLMNPVVIKHYMAAGTTSATTFKVRGGNTTGATTTFNGAAGARLFGGITISSITITEIKG